MQRQRDNRGSATLEIAVLGPAVLLLTFAVVQAGLFYYARSLALAAAQSAVAAGRTYGASPDAARRQAATFLADEAGDSLTATSISTAGSTGTHVQVTITGRCLTVLPGLALSIRQDAQGDRERFTATTGQP